MPWHRTQGSLEATALYWEWMVRKGRHYGSRIPGDYIEIRYEDLISAPQQTLNLLGEFLGQVLDYNRIQSARLGRLSESNSSFRGERDGPGPLNRWRERLSHEEIVLLESMVGICLEELGYVLATSKAERNPGLRQRWMRLLYFNMLNGKFWAKTKTPLGRLANVEAMEL